MKRKLAAFASALLLVFCAVPVKAAGEGIADGSYEDGIYSAVVKLPDESMKIKSVLFLPICSAYGTIYANIA